MAFGPDTNTLLQTVIAKLDGIYRLLEIQNRSLLEAAVRKVATTKERRKAWILSDGQRKNEEIARLSGAALRTVQQFVQDAERSGLMDTSKRGFPRRRYEVIPEEWTAELQEIDKALMPANASPDSAPSSPSP